MMITPESKSVIPFRPRDAKRVGKGCYYLDLIVWLNSEFIELGDEIGFNYGCWVNGFGGLTVGDGRCSDPTQWFTPQIMRPTRAKPSRTRAYQATRFDWQ